MALTVRLDLKQSQQLVMTPQLQQAIKLLQMSNMELSEFVEQELERNPLLKTSEGDERPLETSTVDTVSAPDLGNEPPNVLETPSSPLEQIDFNRQDNTGESNIDSLDVDYENTWNHDSPADGTNDSAISGMQDNAFSSQSSRGGSFDGGEFGIEQSVSSEETLRDHLSAQINVDIVDPGERLIASHLVELLDDSGYLRADLNHVADMFGCDVEDVEILLEKLQRFEPTGIFSRDLRECLWTQLEEKDRLDPAMQALLNNLDLLAKHDYPKLMKICGVDAEDMSDMISEIRALNPRPAGMYDTSLTQPITPDVLMKPGTHGTWRVELNSETLPKVLIDNSYHSLISSTSCDKNTKTYINECFQSANWLVKSLHQRATTILKVATEIVAQQHDFFNRGVQHLKPLILRDIAEVIDMHESTVSRVTSNKYIATPRGIFELKYFFTTAINATNGGDAHSAESVRHRIKTMIDSEDPSKVLSDDKIVAILKDDGIDIARRTVAKYREAMGISSSVQRRREKMSALGVRS